MGGATKVAGGGRVPRSPGVAGGAARSADYWALQARGPSPGAGIALALMGRRLAWREPVEGYAT